MRTGEAGDLRSLSGPRPLTAGAGECRRARPRPSQAASARRSLASAPRPAPGSAPPWGAGLRAPARSTSPGCSALLRREGGREGGDGRTLATCGGVRGDSAAAAPPPPRIARLAGFVLWFFLSLAFSLYPLSRSHNAVCVGFACLKPCGPQSGGILDTRRLQVWVPRPPVSRRSRAG